MKTEFAGAIPRLKKLLPKFRRVRVAVLGDLMLDRYVTGLASRLSPEAPVPVVDFESQTDCLGGAGNVAANLAALGARVQAFGVVGGKKSGKKVADDEAGAAVRARLRQLGIADTGVLADSRRITTVKTRVIARHQQIVRIDHERNDPLAAEIEGELFHALQAALKSLDALVLSDYNKGLISEVFTERVLRACHECKVPVFVKPKEARFVAYAGARVVVCNTTEAKIYLNRSLPDDKSIEEAQRELLHRFGCAAVVITRGEKGMSIFEEGSSRHLHIPAISSQVTYARVGQRGVERGATGRQVFDVTGAGDTVLSVLSLAIAAGASLPDAAFLANTAAGEVVAKLGTATVTPEELAAALHEI
jgi:rfaE bifunctional protein kinase chain/domain